MSGLFHTAARLARIRAFKSIMFAGSKKEHSEKSEHDNLSVVVARMYVLQFVGREVGSKLKSRWHTSCI
jgi:hypothetical protein